MRRRFAVLLVAAGIDLLWGELPNRIHPVAALGHGIGAADRTLTRDGASDRLGAGVVLALAVPLLVVAAALGAIRLLRRLPAPLGPLGEAVVLKQTFAVRALFEHCSGAERLLLRDDLEGARFAVSRMVSRETARLSQGQVASAAIESLSENASDSAVAPWLWFGVGGTTFAAAYRAVNTLDAMVGYRERGAFGMPSARLDDVANFVPARLTAAAIALASGRPSPVWQRTIRDHGQTPSPNSGWPMAAAAYALGVRLEKPGHHVLNKEGPLPAAGDIARARRLVGMALVLVGFGASSLLVRGRQ